MKLIINNFINHQNTYHNNKFIHINKNEQDKDINKDHYLMK